MSIQRYTNRTTPDGVWLDKADEGDWVLYADHLAALTAERERADKAQKALFVPGEMHCAKCKFTLIRTNLYVQNGTTGPGNNETEPCPNGCGPLWPETWERSAREAWSRLETLEAEHAADADRYRWLRGNGAIIERGADIPAQKICYGIGLDAAIDAVREAGK